MLSLPIYDIPARIQVKEGEILLSSKQLIENCVFFAGSSNGRTADSGSVCEGSNPSPAASYQEEEGCGFEREISADRKGKKSEQDEVTPL